MNISQVGFLPDRLVFARLWDSTLDEGRPLVGLTKQGNYSEEGRVSVEKSATKRSIIIYSNRHLD